jgi:small-conductance mechanosensitive channel
MDQVVAILVKFKNLIGSAALIAGVVVALGVVNRILNRQADPTGSKFRNQLIMSAATFAALLIVILGLPLSPTKQGQLLTLIGIIISAAIALSSSTIMGNAMAGIMLKTVRNFRAGDFIQIGEHVGRVTERGLFHTEIQTAERDLVTLPNMYIASTPVTVARSSGTIISATVSLGYDVPQDRVRKLLQDAASSIGLEEPFVQVVDLGDFSVTYRAAGLLTETKKLLTYKSRLRGAILDTLHEGGVEIVSPHFRNVRTYETDRQFIPVRSFRREPAAEDAAPVEVVFDKAEVAESLSALKHQREELEEKLKEERQKAKDSDTDEARAGRETHIALLEKQAARLDAAIARAAEAETGDPK